MKAAREQQTRSSGRFQVNLHPSYCHRVLADVHRNPAGPTLGPRQPDREYRWVRYTDPIHAFRPAAPKRTGRFRTQGPVASPPPQNPAIQTFVQDGHPNQFRTLNMPSRSSPQFRALRRQPFSRIRGRPRGEPRAQCEVYVEVAKKWRQEYEDGRSAKRAKAALRLPQRLDD